MLQELGGIQRWLLAAPLPCLGGSALVAQSLERLGRKFCFHAQETRVVTTSQQGSPRKLCLPGSVQGQAGWATGPVEGQGSGAEAPWGPFPFPGTMTYLGLQWGMSGSAAPPSPAAPWPIWASQLLPFLLFFTSPLCQRIPRQWNWAGSLEGGSLGCWDRDVPHSRGSAGPQPSPFASSKQPLGQALCLPCLFGLWAQPRG